MAGWLEFTLSAAFLAGLGGSAHCAAMCGPLLGIACTPARTGWLRQGLACNAGRIVSYCVAGALTGSLGASGLALHGGPGAQQLALAATSVSLIVLAGYVAGFGSLVRAVERVGAVLWVRLEPYSHRFLPATTPARAFGLGLFWGWLPCGMVYAALFAALATADPLHGAALMGAFGLGTAPALLAVAGWVGRFRRFMGNRYVRAVSAAAIAAVAVAGMASAAQPASISIDGSWCFQIPGIAAMPGSGS